MMYLVEKFVGHEWHPESVTAYPAVARQYIERMTMQCGGQYRIVEVQPLDNMKLPEVETSL